MEKPVRSTFTPLDFVSWNEAKSLVLAPKFQRRGVWTPAARSHFMDTILREMPVPPVYLRTSQSADKKRIVREVVDGQQRLSAVLDYLDNRYALSRSLDAVYAGKRFDQLTSAEQDAIRQYGFICEVFLGISDADILEIFARLNTYSVPLNAQELRNGRFFGYFKQTAYRLAYEHIEFWRRHNIFGERSIARMLEVELTSELLILQMAGFQDKKGTISDFYAEYDDEFKDRRTLSERFKSVIDDIEDAAGQLLRDSEFRRPPLFYTLFAVVYHRTYGIPQQTAATPTKRLRDEEKQSLASAITELSAKIAATRQDEPVQKKYVEFVNACLRQTDNIRPRQTRFDTVYEAAFA